MFISLPPRHSDICSNLDLCWNIVVVDNDVLFCCFFFMMWYQPDRWPLLWELVSSSGFFFTSSLHVHVVFCWLSRMTWNGSRTMARPIQKPWSFLVFFELFFLHHHLPHIIKLFFVFGCSCVRRLRVEEKRRRFRADFVVCWAREEKNLKIWMNGSTT